MYKRAIKTLRTIVLGLAVAILAMLLNNGVSALALSAFVTLVLLPPLIEEGCKFLGGRLNGNPLVIYVLFGLFELIFYYYGHPHALWYIRFPALAVHIITGLIMWKAWKNYRYQALIFNILFHMGYNWLVFSNL